MFIRALFLSLILTVGGCATLEHHPVWTAVGTAIVVGSIAASVEQHQGRQVAPVEDHFFCGCRTQ
jgi:hypothetical protein